MSNYIQMFFNWLAASKWRRRVFFASSLVGILFLAYSIFAEEEMEKQEFYIAYDPNWSYVNLNGQGQEFVGFSEELLSEIGQKEKVRFRLVRSSSSNLFDLVEGGKVDGILSPRSPDSLLLESLLFSDPYYSLGLVLVVPKGENSATLEDLAGKYVGILKGSSVLFYLTETDRKMENDIHFLSFDTEAKALEALTLGKLDGVLMSFVSASAMENSYYNGKIAIVTSPLTQEGLRLIAKRNTNGHRLIDLFNSGLAEAQGEGGYKALAKKWGLFEPLLPSPKKEP